MAIFFTFYRLLGVFEVIELIKLAAFDKIGSFFGLFADFAGWTVDDGAFVHANGGVAESDVSGIDDWWFCWIFNLIPLKFDVNEDGFTGIILLKG